MYSSYNTYRCSRRSSASSRRAVLARGHPCRTASTIVTTKLLRCKTRAASTLACISAKALQHDHCKGSCSQNGFAALVRQSYSLPTLLCCFSGDNAVASKGDLDLSGDCARDSSQTMTGMRLLSSESNDDSFEDKQLNSEENISDLVVDERESLLLFLLLPVSTLST